MFENRRKIHQAATIAIYGVINATLAGNIGGSHMNQGAVLFGNVQAGLNQGVFFVKSHFDARVGEIEPKELPLTVAKRVVRCAHLWQNMRV